eukprot:16553-Heterococcus_DN1.PRE.5
MAAPAAAADRKINIQIQQGTSITDVKIRRSATLGSLFSRYAEARRLQLEELRFLYDGIRLNPAQTVAGATDQRGESNLKIGDGAIHITMSAAVALIVSSGHAAIANSQVVLVTHLVLQIAATVHNGIQHPSSSKFLHSVHAPLVDNVSRKLAHMHSADKDVSLHSASYAASASAAAGCQRSIGCIRCVFDALQQLASGREVSAGVSTAVPAH